MKPENIKAIQSRQILQITWEGEELQELSFRNLRGNCPCAVCVNEFTGVRKFFPADAAVDIHPVSLELTGNYALKINWSDGHNTGIYTWEQLRALK